MSDDRPHIYKLGWHQNKWCIVLPDASGDVQQDLHRIIERQKEIHGRNAVTHFDHIEYLGRG